MSEPFHATRNVFYVGIARVANQAHIIVASTSNHAETDLGAVKEVLDQPTNNFTPGKHFNFTAGKVAWHMEADTNGLVYVLITSPTYSLRCAHACLEELQKTVGLHAATAKENSLNGACKSFLTALCTKYDDLAEMENVAEVSSKVNSVKLVMQNNVNEALQHCVKLDSIEAQAEDLRQAAGVFFVGARRLKNKLWWKSMQMKIVLACIVIAFALGFGLGFGLNNAKK